MRVFISVLFSRLRQLAELLTYDKEQNLKKFSYDLKQLILSRGLFHTFDLHKTMSESRPYLVSVVYRTDLQPLFEFLAVLAQESLHEGIF